MTLGKYWAALAISLRQANAARAAFFGRVVFYGVLIAMYARIWQIVGAHGSLGVFGHRDLIWYLALTEWIALSVPPLHLELENDVRTGAIAYFLPRPISYLWLRFSEALGTMLLRMALLGTFGFAVAWFLASDATSVGALPSGGALALVCGAFVAFLAALLNLVFSALIGLCAFFIQDTSPVYWVWQKLGFVFGGLLFPLELYPDSIRQVASFTPFPSLLYAPGKIAVGADAPFVWHSLLLLGMWGLIGVSSAHFAFGRARKSLEINGG